MHRVPFVSQYDTAYPQGTCGVAATMMLLRYHYRRKRVPSHPELRAALGLKVPPANTNPRYHLAPDFGVRSDQVTAYLRANGVRCRATYRKSKRQLAILLRRLRRGPVMVIVRYGTERWGPSGHWIVLTDASERTVFYFDSAYRRAKKRPASMHLKTFRRDWDGDSVQIVGFH